MSSRDVVIVRVNKIFEGAIVNLLPPERAAIPIGTNVSAVVVNDRVSARSQYVDHSDHNPLDDVSYDGWSGDNLYSSRGCSLAVKALDDRWLHARKLRRLTLVPNY